MIEFTAKHTHAVKLALAALAGLQLASATVAALLPADFTREKHRCRREERIVRHGTSRRQMTRGPQARARAVHRDYEISVERTGGKNMAFSIGCRDGLVFEGFTDEPVTARRFARQLTGWLDKELAEIGSL